MTRAGTPVPTAPAPRRATATPTALPREER